VALVALFVSAFWAIDPFTTEVVKHWNLDNLRTIFQDSTYRNIAARTIGLAAAVTLTDAILAFPLAYFMARVASPRMRSLLFVAVLVPLWSSYLARVYSWRLILSEDGVLNWLLAKLGLPALGVGYSVWAMWIVFSYIWLPFMILPVFAALERIPDSLLEASRDLGAKGARTTRSVVLPLALPGFAAGSIFTFALTLGDFITPQLVGGGQQLIGNVVYANVGIANDVPFAAAYAMVPVAVMAVYLLLARKLGAFEAL
jgi:putative spermidine/putrescine transport system permease protein